MFLHPVPLVLKSLKIPPNSGTHLNLQCVYFPFLPASPSLPPMTHLPPLFWEVERGCVCWPNSVLYQNPDYILEDILKRGKMLSSSLLVNLGLNAFFCDWCFEKNKKSMFSRILQFSGKKKRCIHLTAVQ